VLQHHQPAGAGAGLAAAAQGQVELAHPGRAVEGDMDRRRVLYPEDERYLIDGRSTVTHYQVADQAG
jgi:hypothetical protein